MKKDPEYVANRALIARENAAIRRRAAGIPVRNFRKKAIAETAVSPLVPVDPFLEWFDSLNGSRPTEGKLGVALARAVRRARTGDKDSRITGRKMRLHTVIAVADLVGVPEIVHELYP
jgi:hypothetical protein